MPTLMGAAVVWPLDPALPALVDDGLVEAFLLLEEHAPVAMIIARTHALTTSFRRFPPVIVPPLQVLVAAL
jgi:hypothetical protein